MTTDIINIFGLITDFKKRYKELNTKLDSTYVDYTRSELRGSIWELAKVIVKLESLVPDSYKSLIVFDTVVIERGVDKIGIGIKCLDNTFTISVHNNYDQNDILSIDAAMTHTKDGIQIRDTYWGTAQQLIDKIKTLI
jgi:hypothetical protein